MCDVYVTPYLNEAQMTSGTLAYSFGLGKAVVSTPYWHARELLADGRGILVPFGDAAALGSEIAGLLTDDVRRQAMRKRAYAASRSMTWARTAERYLAVFETRARRAIGHPVEPAERPGLAQALHAPPELRTGHFLSHVRWHRAISACGPFGARSRAWLLRRRQCARAAARDARSTAAGEPRLPEVLTTRFAAFIQHAWNPDTGRFRNFMSYDRRWLEDQGSEDSHGRTLWALGECARSDTDPSRRRWAAALFKQALPVVEDFASPRAWAFSLLGLDAYCAAAARRSAGRRAAAHCWPTG